MDTEQSMMQLVQVLISNSVAAFYPYHNFRHTFYVYEKTMEIARYEQCSHSSLRLLKAAALWHDTGYINRYEQHEEESCKLAQKHLPIFGYADDEIAEICGMIMATRIPQTPCNQLEQILADADLEYLGTDQAEIQSKQLLEELRMIHPNLEPAEWNKTQMQFLRNHHYFTAYCKMYREQNKLQYLHLLSKET